MSTTKWLQKRLQNAATGEISPAAAHDGQKSLSPRKRAGGPHKAAVLWGEEQS